MSKAQLKHQRRLLAKTLGCRSRDIKRLLKRAKKG
jgi:hypothetical protein